MRYKIFIFYNYKIFKITEIKKSQTIIISKNGWKKRI